MAAISRVSAHDAHNNSATSTLTVNYPAATASGNLLVAVCMQNAAANVAAATAAGWTQAINLTNVSAVFGLTILYKISTGDSSVALSSTAATIMQAHIFEFSGAANPAVVDTSATSPNAAGTSGGTGTITTSVSPAADDLFIVAVAQASTNGGSTAWVSATNLLANLEARLISGQFFPTAFTTFSDTASWTTSRQNVGAVVAFKPAVTAKSDTESGTGTDAGESLAVAMSDTESGADTDGGEALAVAGSDTESGAGTDAGETLAVASSDADSGTATDAESVAAAFSDTDTGAAADAGSLAAALSDAESGAVTDAGESTAPAISDAETGTGTDAGESIAAAISTGGSFDNGTVTDAGSLAAAPSDGDTGAATDAVESLADAITDDDPATGVDLEAVAVALSDGDTATGVDDGSLATPLSDSDTGTASDAELVAAAVTDDDSGVAVEFAAIVAALLDEDSGFVNDLGMVSVLEIGGWLVGSSFL